MKHATHHGYDPFESPRDLHLHHKNAFRSLRKWLKRSAHKATRRAAQFFIDEGLEELEMADVQADLMRSEFWDYMEESYDTRDDAWDVWDEGFYFHWDDIDAVEEDWELFDKHDPFSW